MTPRLVLPFVLGAVCAVGCTRGALDVATYEPSDPGLAIAPVVPPAPTEPAYTPALDAALGVEGPMTLTAALKSDLRALQHRSGERPAILSAGTWSRRADVVIDAVSALPDHGVAVDGPAQGALERVRTLRTEILGFAGWTGDASDAAHTQRLVEADRLLAFLWLEAAERYGATRGVLPEEPYTMKRRLLEALARWGAPVALASTLPPPMTQYDALVEVYARYRALQDRGFATVSDRVRRARPGKDHPGLPGLRARLAQEDPAGAGQGERWGEQLTEALRRARASYQLPPKRKARHLIDKALLKALAVPVDDRLVAIELNLERWRRSDLRHFPYVIFVNLPDYHAEVWDGPEELTRFKVVIGNTRKKRGFMVNATPVLTARVATIVYNPFWTVPKRIYEEELVVLAERYESEQQALREATPADEPGDTEEPPPTYWEARGYEVHGEDRADGQIWVRRKPGPGNALGKVKFLFENRWFVFLHDTPQKSKFRKTRRAFSHGCVRVSEPLALAELVLRRDGQWGAVEAARVMRHYEQTVFELQSPVWLVVDYMTARVASGGRAQFLPDVYRKDSQVAAVR